MEPQPEINRGKILVQLRDLAYRASDDGLWNQDVEQISTLTRRVAVQNGVADFINVDFIASKVARSIGSKALGTHYVVQTSLAQEDLKYDLLPLSAIELLRRERVRAGEEDPDALIFRTNDDEVDASEFDGYDDMLFRHARSTRYTLDGRGALLSCFREDFYEESDDGNRLLEVNAKQFDSKLDELQLTVLRGWSPERDEQYPEELLAHPDLRELIYQDDARRLDTDLSFLDIVGRYSNDKNLVRYSKKEHQQNVLSLLAFIKLEASVKDIQDLL